MLRFLTCVLLGVYLLAAHSQAAVTQAETSQKMLEIHYLESEPGIAPYTLRMLVTERYLRLDDGAGSLRYLLYDAETRKVVNVDPENGNFQLPTGDAGTVDAAAKPVLQHSIRDTLDMPDFGGKPPVHAVFHADGQQCFDVVAVPGLYPQAVAVIRSYLQTMSGLHRRNLVKTPVEMRSPCLLANYIYAPVQHLQFGMPIRSADYRGVVRVMDDVKETDLDPSLFTE